MATPTQDALRRALRARLPERRGRRIERRCPAPPGGDGPWRPLAALRPAGTPSGHPGAEASGRGDHGGTVLVLSRPSRYCQFVETPVLC